MAANGSSKPSKNPEVGPYFRVPKGLLQNGIAARIRPSAVALYTALCENANRRNGNTFSVSDRALAADTGIAERTIRDIRTQLFEEELISFTRQPGSSYTYTLIPVRLAQRIPVNERRRQPKKPRGTYHSSEGVAAGLKTHSKPQQTLPHPSGKSRHTTPSLFAELTGNVC
jgi:hypothetical protein